MAADENLQDGQFGPPEKGSKWVNKKTGQPAQVFAVVEHPGETISGEGGSHTVWVERPHRQRRHRDLPYDLESFYKMHTRAED